MMLTKDQKQFCEEYVKSYNIQKAYHIVRPEVVSSHNPYVWMKKPEVKEYIAELQKEAIQQFVSVENLLLKELVEDVLYRDEEGRHSSTWTKSASLIQKQLGLEHTNVNMESAVEININIEGESTNEAEIDKS